MMNPLLIDALAALVLAAADEAARLQARAERTDETTAGPLSTRAKHWLALADTGAGELKAVHDAATLRRTG